MNSIINKLNKSINEFEKLYSKFSTYLSTLRTSDNIQDNSKWKPVLDSTKIKVCDVIKGLKVPKKPSSMTMSGRLSRRSKLSSLLSQGGTKQLGEAVLKHPERASLQQRLASSLRQKKPLFSKRKQNLMLTRSL